MKNYLGVDVGGTKTHALIADENGCALGFALGGPGNWEGVGYHGLTKVLKEVVSTAAHEAGIQINQLAGAGMGIGGYDWPCERQPHLDAIAPLGLKCPLEIVNDASLGILAGARDGWGISIVAGTGCNGRGWSQDHKHEGRAVGGGSHWSGEYAGGFDIAARAMREVTFQWLKRGPETSLTQAFIQHFHADDLDDLVEGVYLQRYEFDSSLVMLVFEIARQGDPQALEVMRWAGDELGQIGVGVIHQLGLEDQSFDVVLIGSLHDGHPLLGQTLRETVQKTAPHAQFIRLAVPPVVGAVLLGMEVSGLNGVAMRDTLISTTRKLLGK